MQFFEKKVSVSILLQSVVSTISFLIEVFERGDERDRRLWRKQGAGGVAAVEILGEAKRDLKISGTATGKRGKLFA